MRSVESTALRVLRGLEEEGEKNRAAAVTVKVASDVAIYILNQKRRELARIEAEHGMEISFEPKEGLPAGTFELERTRTRDPGERPRTIAVSIEAGFVPSDEPEAEYVGRGRRGRRQSKRPKNRPRKSEDEPRRATRRATATTASATTATAAASAAAVAAVAATASAATAARRRRRPAAAASAPAPKRRRSPKPSTAEESAMPAQPTAARTTGPDGQQLGENGEGRAAAAAAAVAAVAAATATTGRKAKAWSITRPASPTKPTASAPCPTRSTPRPATGRHAPGAPSAPVWSLKDDDARHHAQGRCAQAGKKGWWQRTFSGE